MNIVKIDLKEVKNLVNFIKDTGNLDQNSSYLYLLLAKYFPDNCLIAKIDDKIAGFVTSLPIQNNSLFIWQIGVGKDFQKQGIASKLLNKLIKNNSANLNQIEFTISPSNLASLSLFKKYATSINSKVEEVGNFTNDLFFESNHEEEVIYQIKIGK